MITCETCTLCNCLSFFYGGRIELTDCLSLIRYAHDKLFVAYASTVRHCKPLSTVLTCLFFAVVIIRQKICTVVSRMKYVVFLLDFHIVLWSCCQF